MSPYRLELSVPGLPQMNTSFSRRHWGVHHREVKRAREMVAILSHGKRPEKPLRRARVTVTRCSSMEGDFDNYVFSGKHLIDALVHNGILEDDSPRHLEREYRWEYAPRGKGKVVIVVEEVV